MLIAEETESGNTRYNNLERSNKITLFTNVRSVYVEY